MLTKIKNFLHITVLMNLYSLRNFITGNGAVWLKLKTSDLENMAKKAIDHNSIVLSGKNVLDLGCGTGTMLSYIYKEENCIPYGVDLIRLNIHQCRRKMPNGKFFRQDIMKYLDETKDKFNLVMLYGVIGCFTVDKQKEIIAKIADLLNPGGLLWIGANIYTDSSYKFQTYPVPRGFYEGLCLENKSLRLEEIQEEEIFGNVKYDPDQTTVFLTKNA
ncbi:MAG: class I SAM-dependent methyltransferase [Candidatus Poseidoniales archaeon]